MAYLTQYYNVKIGEADVTGDVLGEIRIEEEDGVFSTLILDLRNGYLYLDALGLGNSIVVKGGNTEEDAQEVFIGYISIIKPTFEQTGDITIKLKCFPLGHVETGISEEDLLYPDEDSIKEWARESPLNYSYIIEQLAIDNGYDIGEINVPVKSELQATFKSPLSQEQKTSWSFMGDIAEKLGCVIWEENVNGKPVFYCVDESKLVNRLADITFYYVARKGKNAYSVEEATENMIRMKEVTINLDTSDGLSNSKITSKVDATTGEETLATDEYDPKTGNWTRYVFDEDLLLAESDEKKNEILQLIQDNKFHLEDWTVLKKYFKAVDSEDLASEEQIPEEFEVEILNEDGDFVPANDVVKQGSNKQYSLNQDALKGESPEKRAELLGKTARGELSDEEFAQYFIEKESSETTTLDETAEATTETETETTSATDSDTVTRRDAGFNIKVLVNGDNRIRTKISYVLEGISKYSGSYYLYKIERKFSAKGYKMTLTFTK